MAQAVKIDVVQAMKMGVKLPLASLNSLKEFDIVPAKNLAYADLQAWKFNCDTAEFLGGNPQVDGTYDVKNLSRGLIYEVFYYLTMNDHQVADTVNLILELPNGSTQETNSSITVEPGVWLALSVGKFINMFTSGDIKYSFSGVNGDTWKGLLIQCVVITPSF